MTRRHSPTPSSGRGGRRVTDPAVTASSVGSPAPSNGRGGRRDGAGAVAPDGPGRSGSFDTATLDAFRRAL
ncbi:MAG TPA: hypothetical protein VJG13_14895, partial [Thermoanaerobaculia bacterium]|nr:hypothetical protein [Thermoanaerobaculia bacterium]